MRTSSRNLGSIFLAIPYNVSCYCFDEKRFYPTPSCHCAPPSGTVPDGYCITEKLPLHFKEALRRTRRVRAAAAAAGEAEGEKSLVGDSLKVKKRHQMGDVDVFGGEFRGAIQ